MKKSIALGLIISAISAPVMATDMATPPAGGYEQQDMAGKGKKSDGMKNRMDARMDKMWEEMDENKDGSISSAESEAFNKKKFDARDANKDSKVTREEWDAYGEGKKKEYMEKMKNRGDSTRKTATPPEEAKK